MKKLKLFMAAFALILGWSSAWAQNPGDDYTSSITNPTFTNNADGWTITGDARYFTNGKGFDGTTNFIELTNWGSSWNATISQTVTVPNGYYRVKAAGQMSGTSDCWMKLVANGAESRFSRNGDTGGNILANGTETTIGSGVAGWRYTSVIAKVTDGSLAISCVGHSDSKERWANFDHVTLTFLGTEFAPNTDVTDYISNWDFWGCFNDEFNGWTISKTGGNSWVHGNTAVEHWSNDLSRTFDFYQTISNLPEGRYTISASMWNTQGSGPNGNSGVYGTSNGVTAFAGVTDDCGDTDLHTYSTSIFVNNGNLQLGVKNNGDRSAFWFGVDWIKLNYEGKEVQDYAVALPAGGAMEADTWYYFDIAVAGDEYNATADDLSKIICTDDGSTLTSAESGDITLTATDNTLAVKRYYVKSTTDNNLVISVASYTYTVSSATADKAYVQPGQTVTVSYTVSTNDPGATLDQDYSGVTFDEEQINVTPGASGFTFTVPANLEAGISHTLYIPAGAIGYDEGSTYNETQNITLKTPAIYDGVYYMYNTYTESYISRAGSYNTQAVLDNWGLAFKVSTDANNNTQLQYFDSELYLGDDGFCYGDCNTSRRRFFNVSKVTGGYKFLNTNNSKYLAANSGATVADAVEGGNLVGTSNIWALESTDAHVDNYTTNANAQAAAAATAAGIAGVTTKAALDAELASNYGETKITITGSKAEKYQQYPGNGQDSGPLTYYSETVEDLKPGLYKLTVAAFQRAAGNNRVASADGARSLIYLYAGGAKTQLKSVMEYGAAEAYTEGDNPDYEYEGKHYPNSQASAYTALATGEYNNEVYVYVEDAGSGTGSLEIGIKNPSRPGSDCGTWAVYNTWSLALYEAKATSEEKAALAAAITAAEGKTLGFEDEEYAPYNNVDALTKLAAAKAINPETASGAAVVAATNALKGATWTPNANEVNAIFDGSFAHDYSGSVGNVQPIGWHGVGDKDNATNVRYMNDVANNPGLAAATNSTALFAKFTAQYGTETGYTMPLKAGAYSLNFIYGGWNEIGTREIQIYNATNNATISPSSVTAPNNSAHTNPESWRTYNGVFVVPADGDYILSFYRENTVSQNQLVISDISIYSVPAQSKTISAAGWATYCSPYALDFSDVSGLKAYIVKGTEGETTELDIDEVTSVPANTGVLLEGSAGTYNIPVLASADAVSGNKLVGVLEDTEIDAEAGYVLMNETAGVGFYKNKKAFTVGANTAYLPADFATSAVTARAAYFFRGGITEVENIEAAPAATVKKNGAYLENGKIAIYKNGMKFSATGAQLK